MLVLIPLYRVHFKCKERQNHPLLPHLTKLTKTGVFVVYSLRNKTTKKSSFFFFLNRIYYLSPKEEDNYRISVLTLVNFQRAPCDLQGSGYLRNAKRKTITLGILQNCCYQRSLMAPKNFPKEQKCWENT